MEAKDLRIGNLFNQFGRIHKVSWETLKTLSESTVEQLWCKPIPLTEEWLLKFGFEKNTQVEYSYPLSFYPKEDFSEEQETSFYISFENGISVFIDNVYNPNGDLDCISIPYPHIKHVHSLQNLYFALTGEELTIKTN